MSGDPAGRPKGEGATVLVVDDNSDNLLFMSEILEKHGFAVHCANDGPSALRLLEQHRPGVILLDIMMPGMDGMEVLDRIKGNPTYAEIPVILVTAKSRDSDMLAGYKFGADYYLPKPFTPRQLLYGVGLVLGAPPV